MKEGLLNLTIHLLLYFEHKMLHQQLPWLLIAKKCSMMHNISL